MDFIVVLQVFSDRFIKPENMNKSFEVVEIC